jgi:hypothetical protein
MKLTAVIPSLLLIFLATVCFGQKISKIKPGSADYKAIIQQVTPFANEHAAHPVRVTGDLVRRSGDWAFLVSRLDFLNPTYKGDGELMALLKKGRKWTIREITVGSGGMEDMAADWEKKHKLPKGLVAR